MPMKTYDDVVGFDYTNAEEWQNFVKNQILPTYKSVSKIIGLREKLEELFRNNLSDLIRNSTNIKQILLGGVDENGDYKSNSLARIYKEFLGVSINTKEWVSLSKQPGIDAAEYIKCNFTDTPFLQFVKDIKEIVDRLLYLAEIDEEEVKDDEIEDILENPGKIVNELKDIYTRLVGISANHSYYTFFTINTRCIPRYYIEQAYPKLKYKFEKVAEFLGLEPKFIPDIKEGEIKRNYTLWGHKENGFADLLYRLNEIIWRHFSERSFDNPYFFREKLKLLYGIPDLKEKYTEKVERSLGSWKLDNLTIPNEEPVNFHEWDVEYYLEVKNALIVRYYNTYSDRYYKKIDRRIELPLFEVMDKMAPALFVGLVNLEVKGNDLVYDGNYLRRI